MQLHATIDVDSQTNLTLQRLRSEVSLTLSKNSLFVFDLDGVLISATEERVYRLPEAPSERTKLVAIARRYAIEPSLYDTQYLRHLVYQEMLAELQSRPSEGPMLNVARELCSGGTPVFVLTARSGPAAISRALTYLSFWKVRPQEIFFVGRVAKGRQLRLLANTHKKRHLVYIDDSARHIRNARQSSLNVSTIHVRWSDVDQDQTRRVYERVVKRVLGGDDEQSAAA